MTVEEEKLGYKSLPPARTDFGYEWQEIPIEDLVEKLGLYFKRQKAKAFIMDVYATNNCVYRNMLIQLPWLNSFFVAENIRIQFNKDEGRQLSISRE